MKGVGKHQKQRGRSVDLRKKVMEMQVFYIGFVKVHGYFISSHTQLYRI